jgi:hypothetical protein
MNEHEFFSHNLFLFQDTVPIFESNDCIKFTFQLTLLLYFLRSPSNNGRDAIVARKPI